MLSSLLHLFYPHTCEICGMELSRKEEILCVRCSLKLPLTLFHKMKNNPAEMIFAGRVPVQFATAGYYFRQDAAMQTLIHQFKYRRREDIALFLGRQLGLQLRESNWWNDVTAMIPVPLHSMKLRHRGYNQAAVLAAGIAGVLPCPVWENALQRNAHAATQTHKTRIERWENADGRFSWKMPPPKSPAHLVLIDDVMTTGATLEACSNAILKGGEHLRVSICTLAYADR